MALDEAQPAQRAAGSHPACDARELTKTFVGGRALDSVDLLVGAGQVHALLGENGSGKSTLIKILSGYHRPDAGVVHIGAGELTLGSAASSYELGARFVHQDLGLVEGASVSDNLSFGPGFPTRLGTIKGRTARESARAALAVVGLDIDPRQTVSSLSPADKTGVAVARALRVDDDPTVSLLVMDEPTARLPEAEVERLLDIVRRVARGGVGVLYVTHRLDEVFEIAQTATVLRDGRKVTTEQISGLTRDELLGQLLGAARETPRRLQEHRPVAAAEAVLTATNVGSEALRNLTFEVFPGEIVGVAGITGSGRDALCGTLFGARPRDTGEVLVRGAAVPPLRPDLSITHNVAYIPAERKTEGGFLSLSARENIAVSTLSTFWKAPFLRGRPERAAVRTWFDRFDIRPKDGVNAPFWSFSGGNQQKIVFGKWFQRRPALLLLDEPTQGVDVGAKAQLHDALFAAAGEGSAILLSSSDTDELVATCDRVIVLRGGRMAATLTGSAINPRSITRVTLGLGDHDQESVSS